ncbi:MAG: DNA polymerase I [Desulfovibrio sp.]|jgi:DNA polymerase-1|nr:DNA polymerase I [Desulfovibrio sp.]
MSLRSRLSLDTDPVYLMDGSAFVFRSFYALQGMTRSDGFPTNILYMVTRLLFRLLREERPRHFAFVLDGRGEIFRHRLFPAYKAHRSATPEPLARQMKPLCGLVDALGLKLLVAEDCEADDCIASLACALRGERPVVLLGTDKDLKQCLHDNVFLWDPAARDERLVSLADFRRETGFSPESWPDYQALVGDSSDNIPGVPQVGPKTALGLIREFPHLEDLFDRLAAVPPKIRAKLEGQKENALLCRELTTLRTDRCRGIGLAELALRPTDRRKISEVLSEYELRSLIREMESMYRAGFFDRDPVGVPPQAPPPGESCRTGGPEGKDLPPPAGKISSLVQADLFSSFPAPGAFVPAGDPAALPGFSGPDPEHFACETLPSALNFDTRFPLRLREGERISTLSPPERLQSEIALALVPLAVDWSGLLLAGRFPEPWERLYAGSLDDLVQALLPYARELILVAPDSKTLIRKQPALRHLPREAWFDLSLAAHLLNPEDRGHSWPHLAARWGESAGLDPGVHPGLLALTMRDLFLNRLASAGLLPVFADLEMPLIPILADMEERGIAIDREAFTLFLAEVQAELDLLTSRIHSQAGQAFNIRSGPQLADILFSVLRLPRVSRTRGGAASTSQESLERLAGKHPVVETILQFRKLEKLRSTYLDPLPLLADAQSRIHTTFHQTATATGRLSSSDPNLQNIPIRGPMGNRMRSCFIAAPGRLLICADYSQIELRILAHLSGDPTLLEAFRGNEDIHARTAGLLFDREPAAVSAEQRRNAKTINFGIIYGMGAKRLARELGITPAEGQAFIDRYFQRFSSLRSFYEAVEEEAGSRGFVSTMTGRRRFIPEIASRNNQLRTQARRQAINTRIQGSAADIIKLAMLAVDRDTRLQDLDARLLLQIHDELVLESPAANAEEAVSRLADLMGNVRPGGSPLLVPLQVSCAAGATWAEAHGA